MADEPNLGALFGLILIVAILVIIGGVFDILGG